MMRTVKEIKDYLDRYIEGQEDAKRVASVLVYNNSRGIKENICFVGPSGCGKTEIFRVLSNLYPRKIYIHTASGHSTEGFKGNKKYYSCFNDMYAQGWSIEEMEHAIVVLDEFDKVVEPTGSSEGNLSHEFQREFLTMVEGSKIKISAPKRSNNFVIIGDDEGNTLMDTRNVSFVFCGAFEGIFAERRKNAKSVPLGFATEKKDERKKEVTTEDLIKFGMRNELAGRISQVATLYALTKDQVRNLLSDPYRSPISQLALKYKYNVLVTNDFMEELVNMSQVEALGVRSIYSAVQKEIDKEIYEEGSSGKVRISERIIKKHNKKEGER